VPGLRHLADARGDSDRRPVTVSAIPFSAWGNRGSGAMRVWLPCSD
jgi:DUF1680 family protein